MVVSVSSIQIYTELTKILTINDTISSSKSSNKGSSSSCRSRTINSMQSLLTLKSALRSNFRSDILKEEMKKGNNLRQISFHHSTSRSNSNSIGCISNSSIRSSSSIEVIAAVVGSVIVAIVMKY